MKEFLTIEERESLRRRHRSEKDGRTRDRIKAVLLADKGWSFKAIAEALLLDEETVSKHVEVYVEEKKLSIQTGGSQSKLNKAQTKELVHHIETTTYLKVSNICTYVKATYGVSYTVSGMRCWLQKNKFSYKKPAGVPLKADPEKQAAFIHYYNTLMTTTPEDEPILFGDGVHPTMATKVTYGWIRRGSRKPIATVASRTRLNLMGALNLETMGVTISSYETLDSMAMEQYFDVLKSSYPNAPKIHFIVDRGPYNTSFVTKEAARKRDIVLHYLPPYSPNLNPIERLWKLMNECVRNNRFFENAQQFRFEIMEFFEKTWPKIAHSMVDRINDNFQILKSAF
jgi:transposase